MKSKISLAFKKCRAERRPALITFTVAGDNTKENSLKILNSISKHADILELSFLHNCPIADGNQIQNSTYRALKNGTTLNDTFQIAKKFKKNCPDKPLILMGYYNLIYQLVSKLENISPSLEPSHAFAEAIKIAPKLKSSDVIVVNSCGDSIKDRDIIKQKLGSYVR